MEDNELQTCRPFNFFTDTVHNRTSHNWVKLFLKVVQGQPLGIDTK